MTYCVAINVDQGLARRQAQTPGGAVFEASFLIGGEVLGARCRSFLVYPEGNYIASSPQTPFLQIGEIKYGKPILDRVIDASTTLDDAVLTALLSMDATTRSNLTVGPPIEVTTYQNGSLQPGRYIRFGEDSAYLRQLRRDWNRELRESFQRLPPVDWNEADP